MIGWARSLTRVSVSLGYQFRERLSDVSRQPSEDTAFASNDWYKGLVNLIADAMKLLASGHCSPRTDTLGRTD